MQMSYLHWATSGDSLDHRNAVIKELANKLRDPFYKRPTSDEIEAKKDRTTELKILRAFLYPVNDCSLHIPRTLDQYYYSTLPDADERTSNQVVYKFARKQHNRRIEEAARAKQEEKERERYRRQRRRWETSESSLRSDRSYAEVEVEAEEKRVEVSWDPPKVMMVNQLWMWIINGGEFIQCCYPRCYAYLLVDTVITSFPSKYKSELSMDDRANREDYMEGDDIYDSTDIWRAVQRELRYQTTYGQRTAKSVLDLVWTIADQARGVFQKRDLHPHLQFIQIFEMEINEIVGY
jgi:hypothetical protein